MTLATAFQTLLLLCLAAPITNQIAPGAAERVQTLVQSIEVPAGERLVLRAEASGYQVYRCDGASSQWTFVAPEVKLFVQGVVVGSHAAGPVWRYQDGSAVFGEVLAKAPSSNADSIPQLLLKAASREGTGLLSSVNYIQRLKTQGGTAPASGCDAAHIGAESRVAYSATYAFYAAK